MKPRQFSPEKLDIAAFIEAQEEIKGQYPVAKLTRLAASLAPEADVSALSMAWSAKAWLAPQKGGASHRWMSLQAHALLPWTCQRCLHSVELPVDVDTRIRWVDDEAQAAALDAEIEEDVLAMVRQFDIFELIEDECIMESPLVPRHDTCPVPVVLSTSDLTDEEMAAENTDRPNPFAALAALKLSKKEGGA
jgi:uncharacterized protein